MSSQLKETFLSIVAIDSPSKQEQSVAAFALKRLQDLGFTTKQDQIGNVIGLLPGQGEPILLNAHMDRVPPGKGNKPVIDGDVVKSDGTTNLGADDAAGMAIILEASRMVVENNLPHPPIVVAFTVQEENGLNGARVLDLSEYDVHQGITYDNATAPGVVMGRGATYVAIDADFKGNEGHPGKDPSHNADMYKVLATIIKDFPFGEVDNGLTRINLGSTIVGRARNIVPGNLTLSGEIRSFLSNEVLHERVEGIKQLLQTAAQKFGAQISFTEKQLARAYEVSPGEPLVNEYRKTVEQRGGEFEMQNTFVASDANVLRGEKGMNMFVVSTGVQNEHKTDETANLEDLQQLTQDLVILLQALAHV